MKDFSDIKSAVLDKRVRFRQHSAEMMIERNISKEEVYKTIVDGEFIEEYLSDKPFPSYLVFYNGEQNPLHVVCSYNNIDEYAVIITVYKPDMNHFEDDYKTRRKKHG
jgi:hypothetical protein